MTGPLHQQSFHKEHRIVGVQGDPLIVERLLEMGFAPGEVVNIRNQMMFSGPFIIEVQGTAVALRQEEAMCVQVLL